MSHLHRAALAVGDLLDILPDAVVMVDRATRAAETDALTGAGNRLRLSRRMQAMLQAERPFALLYLDLTSFKPLNDRLGHATGDEALRIVARRLCAATCAGTIWLRG